MIKLISKILQSIILSSTTYYDELYILIKPYDLQLCLKILRDNTVTQFKQLIDISTVDYPERGNRFEVIYHLLSIKYSKRISIRTFTDELMPLQSMCALFSSSNWSEREAWDMMGIFFKGHPDLRRILTDYGFSGYPLRKDFPLSGYLEVRYDDSDKHIRYEPIELAQEFRNYDYLSPWSKHVS